MNILVRKRVFSLFSIYRRRFSEYHFLMVKVLIEASRPTIFSRAWLFEVLIDSSIWNVFFKSEAGIEYEIWWPFPILILWNLIVHFPRLKHFDFVPILTATRKQCCIVFCSLWVDRFLLTTIWACKAFTEAWFVLHLHFDHLVASLIHEDMPVVLTCLMSGSSLFDNKATKIAHWLLIWVA